MNTFFTKRARDSEQRAVRGEQSGTPLTAHRGDPSKMGALTEATRPPSVPLYVAGGVVQLAALAAVAFQIAEPAFAYFTFILTIVGLFVSYNLRKIGASPRLLVGGIVLLGLIFLYALRGMGVFGAIIPLEAQGSQEMLLISALAFTASFSSFLLLTDESVIFTCVWAIAMIGLTGTVNINRELILSFAVFLAAATFLLIHQNALAQSAADQPADDTANYNGAYQQMDRERHGPTHARLLKTQAVMAGLAWFASIILGFIVAIPVQMVGRNLSLGTIIQRLKVPPSATGRAASMARLVFDNVNEFRVGVGPIDDDPTERMSVLTEEPQYWRGRVFDFYNGRGWQNTYSDQVDEIPTVPNGDTAEGFAVFDLIHHGDARKKTVKQTHRFHVNGGIAGPIYHAAEPWQVRAPIARLNERPDNTMGAGRNSGTDYEVDSQIAKPIASDLRATSTKYPDAIVRLYVNQGRDNDALQALTREALASAVRNNPYDRVLAIRNFISNRCVYTRDARAVPNDRDSVEFFLSESKEGYCDLYASSMVMLCRYAGIPARIATGYAPGQPDENWKPKPGDKRLRYILRGSDQHAWAEVFFVGYGWLPFDATQDTAALTAPARTPEPEKKETPFEKWLRTGRFAIAFIGIGLVGIFYVVYNEFFRTDDEPRTARGGGRTEAGQVTRIYFNTLRQVERRAFRRNPTQTPSEYVRRLRTEFDADVATRVGQLTHLAEGAFYGPEAITIEHVRQAKAASSAVAHALREQRERAKNQTKKEKGERADASGA